MKRRCEQNSMNQIGNFALLSVLLLMSFQGVAQDEVDDDFTPPENEIVCFAAKKKWVCAPENEREKAHEKAMQLVENNEVEEIELQFNSNVQIQTIKPNNKIKPITNQSLNNSQSRQTEIDRQIKDFTPREAAANEQVDEKDTVQPVEETIVEPATVTKNVTEPTQEPIPDINEKEITSISTAKTPVVNGFSDWQNNHRENWSFQVIGTSNRHHLNDFIRANGLADIPHAIVKTQANGADWWVVLAGLFESRDEAINRRHELPPQLSSNAWVRQIKTIIGVAD